MKNGNEGMDCKKLTLLFLQKLWIVLLAAVVGAAVGGGIYLLRHAVFEKNREYRAESKLYLDFAPDETGEVYQEYNGYTWNDLLSTTWILDTTMSYLPDSYTREEVTEASLAEILSDLRLLTITVTTKDAERTAAILQATDQSLVDLGKQKKEFLSIEIIKETEPEVVVTDTRLLQAAIVGCVIALALTMFFLAISYVVSDKIYVPYDLKQVTELPFIGFSLKQPEGNLSYGESRLMERLQADLDTNRAYLEKRTGKLAVLEMQKDSPVTDSDYESLRRANGVLLAVSYGQTDRASLAYQIGQLALQECELEGILIKDADMRFLKWYYNRL
ncbi:MAG: hypothetical protein NC318_10445 [Blautia sp.]|nr:hypothetical protein [Lachnoclostridium sp.]MCM1212012.1 hypothetical protein [Blautia sp.]